MLTELLPLPSAYSIFLSRLEWQFDGMSSPLSFNPPIQFLTISNHHNPKFFKRNPQLTSPLTESSITNFSRTTISSNSLQIKLQSSLISAPCSRSIRASSNGSAESFTSKSLKDEEVFRAPNFVEFVTSERAKVVIMLAFALALCNADRVVMSVAIVPLSLLNGWSTSFAGVVQSSFLWGYFISPIAGGVLVDYYGGKVVMSWGVALWSLSTFLTPWAAETSLWMLLAARAMLGIAEGVALPCMNSMIPRWFPQAARARAVGIAMAGFQLGSAVGLVLSPIFMAKAGVFGPFVIFGLSGFLWVLVWVSAISSTPDRSPHISKFELNYILKNRQQSIQPSMVENKQKSKVIPPFKRLLSKPPTWSLMIANAMHSWGFFVILSWMPIYFNSIYHVNLRQAAWFSAVPWSMMALIGYFAGAWSDMLIHGGISITLTRKIMQSIGFVGPGIALIGLTRAQSPSVASAWLTLAVGLKSFSHSGFLVNIQEIAPEYTGILHGLSNTAGTFAAILGTVGAGYFVEIFGSFKGFLWLTSLLYFLAAIFWNVFSTGDRVSFDESGAR
ncbi:Probable anion transporter 4, chloroplastic, variant 2 [Ancistrocladus abbreviatus]